MDKQTNNEAVRFIIPGGVEGWGGEMKERTTELMSCL